MTTANHWYAIVKKGHFWLLLLLLINFLLKLTTGFHFRESIAFGLKIILYLSGGVLFFRAIKPLKMIAFYYVIYPLSVAVIALFLCMGGIFFAILGGVAMMPVFPDSKVFDNGKARVYEPFSGFLGACCHYTFEKPVLFLFEQRTRVYNGSPAKIEWDEHGKELVIKPEGD